MLYVIYDGFLFSVSSSDYNAGWKRKGESGTKGRVGQLSQGDGRRYRVEQRGKVWACRKGFGNL